MRKIIDANENILNDELSFIEAKFSFPFQVYNFLRLF